MAKKEKMRLIMYLDVDLLEWIKHPANKKAYGDWLNHPVTQTILNGFRRVSTRMIEPTAEKALQEVGFQAGRDSVLLAMRTLDQYAPEGELDVDYGKFKYLVEIENYSPEDAKRIIAEGNKNG